MLVGICLALGLTLADRLYPLDLPEHRDSFATVVVDRNGEPLRSFADNNGVWRYEVSAHEVSALYIDALIHYEDQYFYQHFGVNPLSLIRAGWQYVREGKVVSGGSTLTMQVARILHPHRRTLVGKLQQMLRATQLEWHLSKTEILELYLNYAPFGGTLEGVQAASLQYLHKPASTLRHSEAALLAVLPQAPSRLRPDRHPERAQRARDKVLKRMHDHELWSADIVLRSQQEKIAVWPLHTLVEAPLLSRRLHQNYPEKRIIRTSIDLSLQQQFADTVRAYISVLEENVSAAVLLLDNQTQQVLVYIGSANFEDNKRAGHVDMVTATRSPGSTLKPFLFGISLDENLIHSQSLLADVPRLGSKYRPGNFSEGFAGPISAADALIRSLNLPFVQLIETYGPQNFVNKLEHAGVHVNIPGGSANPSVILGGVGVSLERLVRLYSALANNGRVQALSYFNNNSQPSSANKENSRELLSSASAWITWRTLNDVVMPRDLRYGVSAQGLPPIGWKTGTSWDYRDVWAIGVSNHYTLGVWLGRPDGKPMEKTTGSLLAGPLLFSLYGQLPYEKESLRRPLNVDSTMICWPDGRTVSLVRNDHCHFTKSAFTIDGATPRTLNPSYKKGKADSLFYQANQTYLLNSNTHRRVTRDCEDEYEIVPVYLWPDLMEPWLEGERRRRNIIPPYDDRCQVIKQVPRVLRLSGINQGQIYHKLNNDKLSLKVEIEGGSGQFYWYLDGQLQQGNAPELAFDVSESKVYEILVEDKAGAFGRVLFEVL